MLTVSPSLTLTSFTTPAWLAGISMDALSDSTVIRLCSTFTVSPTLTSSSITETSLKSPISGTRTSTGPDAAAPATGAAEAGAAATETGAAGADAAGAGASLGVETGPAAAPAASTITTTEPSFTLSPKATLISLTTPAVLEGISIEALSLSTVIRLCSTRTVSPTLTSISMTATSSKSPISGTFTSTSAMLLSHLFVSGKHFERRHHQALRQASSLKGASRLPLRRKEDSPFQC